MEKEKQSTPEITSNRSTIGLNSKVRSISKGIKSKTLYKADNPVLRGVIEGGLQLLARLSSPKS